MFYSFQNETILLITLDPLVFVYRFSWVNIFLFSKFDRYIIYFIFYLPLPILLQIFYVEYKNALDIDDKFSIPLFTLYVYIYLTRSFFTKHVSVRYIHILNCRYILLSWKSTQLLISLIILVVYMFLFIYLFTYLNTYTCIYVLGL